MTAAATQRRVYNPISGSSCVPPTYASDLELLRRNVAGVIDEARSIVAGLSDAQFNWKPSPDQWSVAQCLKHLVLTGTFAANGQESAIERLQSGGKRSDGPYTYHGIPAALGRMISRGVEPPVRKRYKTGRKVVPTGHHDRDVLLAEFIAVHERLGHAIVGAEGLDLGAASVPLPDPDVLDAARPESGVRDRSRASPSMAGASGEGIARVRRSDGVAASYDVCCRRGFIWTLARSVSPGCTLADGGETLRSCGVQSTDDSACGALVCLQPATLIADTRPRHRIRE